MDDRLPFGKPVRVVDDERLRAYRRAHPVCELDTCFRPTCPEPHHLVPRNRGRDDAESNLLALCRLHHLEFHRIGGRQWFWRHRAELLDAARAKVAAALQIEDAA